MKRYNFTILIEKDEDGIYVGYVPALKVNKKADVARYCYT